MIAIGVDPGSYKTGYGVVRRNGSRLIQIASGAITTPKDASDEQRLLAIHRGLDEVVTGFGPDEAVVEDVFFAKNARTSLKLGQVRGAILLTLARREIPVTSYSPALVKRAVVGTGRAAKSQVQRVVQAILGMSSTPAEDEGDALALAICFLNASRIKRS